ANPTLKIAIEVHGDYWHANPKFYKSRNFTQGRNVGRDKIKKRLLEKNGWDLVILWENEINDDVESCISRIEETLQDCSENPWDYTEIEYIGRVGKTQTYDIDVDDPEHNYVANTFVVHNSHSVSYGLVAFWEMWIKIYYPVEFMSICLSYGPDDKKAEFIVEARRLGIKMFLPDINKSDSKIWQIGKDSKSLLIPLTEIKGVGKVATDEIVAVRADGGPFEGEEDLVSRVVKRKVNSRVRKLLNEVGAFSQVDDPDKDMTEGELEDISKFFNFNLSNDPAYKYRKVLNKMVKHGLEINLIANEDYLNNKNMNFGLFFGWMERLRFGYRGKFDNEAKRLDLYGTKDAMGGVYGNFIDKSDFIMLVFGTEIYSARKYDLEHCENKWLLVKANRPWVTVALHAEDVWFADDMLKGDIGTLGLKFIKPANYPKSLNLLMEEIESCDSCSLRSECTKPVPPSVGQFNVMIIGEAPGKDENRLGKSFVGDTGKILFGERQIKGLKSLPDLGIEREWCHVTNVVKCWPNKTKTPKRTSIKICGNNFLKKEIVEVKPYIILAFGNTCNQFFRGEDKGIMNLNATTSWNDEYNCWICWSNHPTTVLYSKENIEPLNEALENFANKVYSLGFGENGR
ncbi:MAG: uracil-DNA glycosylase family protein, partial [bacterium]